MVEQESQAESGLALVLRRLTETIKAAEADGGATYDRMAERIRSNAAEGLIAEAIGYVPPEAEPLSVEDVFRPRKAKSSDRSGFGNFSRQLKKKLQEEP